jgi:hypothetical protein
LGCGHLQGAIAELVRKCKGLLARRQGTGESFPQPVCVGHQGQHPSQLDPIVERPSQSLSLARNDEGSL